MTPLPTISQNQDVALVLAGGNAVGAYLAGAYEQLHEQGVRPNWIIGASVGAITGSLLAGNAPELNFARFVRL